MKLGSGRLIIALQAVIAIETRRKLHLAPTEILAVQHFPTLAASWSIRLSRQLLIPA